VKLRPLKDRVLILPEPPIETTASGLILAEHRKPEQTGTVIAVGSMPHPKRDEAEAIAQKVSRWAGDWTKNLPESLKCYGGTDDFGNSTNDLLDAASLLRELVNHQPQVQVGDYVVFSWTAGQEIWVEDGEERYLLLRESDILAVVDGLETA